MVANARLWCSGLLLLTVCRLGSAPCSRLAAALSKIPRPNGGGLHATGFLSNTQWVGSNLVASAGSMPRNVLRQSPVRNSTTNYSAKRRSDVRATNVADATATGTTNLHGANPGSVLGRLWMTLKRIFGGRGARGDGLKGTGGASDASFQLPNGASGGGRRVKRWQRGCGTIRTSGELTALSGHVNVRGAGALEGARSREEHCGRSGGDVLPLLRGNDDDNHGGTPGGAHTQHADDRVHAVERRVPLLPGTAAAAGACREAVGRGFVPGGDGHCRRAAEGRHHPELQHRQPTVVHQAPARRHSELAAREHHIGGARRHAGVDRHGGGVADGDGNGAATAAAARAARSHRIATSYHTANGILMRPAVLLAAGAGILPPRPRGQTGVTEST
ncbi:hypothetical protein BBBOND_0402630 [Babesia bigemina]|uniref:Uncharacterized protein n=1 Tax=Babesia bigemina TaxID=5866 RepID=A0A061DES2_BABBI|nr:hypothetical protein BBBOND_0402630 [Babesia bigemina]CDR97775.1 hypothetical protein BBBOND_0402630 [Babesia bigemina]|eukprot:XP_012769961.1 hypothetical protein BBBOND_0402630 [Babesia bigemina]